MRKYKLTFAWVLVMSLLMGSFAPVQSVLADTVTTEMTSETESTTENSSENTTEANGDSATEVTTEMESTTENTTETGGETITEEVIPEDALPDSEKMISDLSPISAKVVVIDPGHCGVHPGAYGNRLREEVVVMDISEACRAALKQYGDVTIYMTREDGTCCRSLELGGCLTARNNYAKILDADFLVSMHINAGWTNGANVLSAYKSGYHDEIRVETQEFGRIALKKLKALGIANRGLLLRKSECGDRYKNGSLADYYSIVRLGVIYEIPSVIIEHGYISSYSDCSKFFNTVAKRKKLGKADAKAIVSYYGLKKKVTEGSFKNIDGELYYITDSGKKLTGWIKDDEYWYYFDKYTGKMRTGFLEYEGETVYLSPSTGEMVVGWFMVGDDTYLAKGNGAIVKNQTYDNGLNTYLFDENGVQLKKGFHAVDGANYYVGKEAAVQSGVVKVKGKYYGFDPETKQQLYGYQKIKGKYYYFNQETGAAVTKQIVKVKGKNYYFGKKGVRTTGWVTLKGSKYYFNKNGAMAKGWKKVSGRYYFFNKSTGKMQKNRWIGRYYVNSKGIRTRKR